MLQATQRQDLFQPDYNPKKYKFKNPKKKSKINPKAETQKDKEQGWKKQTFHMK